MPQKRASDKAGGEAPQIRVLLGGLRVMLIKDVYVCVCASTVRVRKEEEEVEF